MQVCKNKVCEKIDALIWYDYFIDIRAGGPPGYIANLRYAIDRLPIDSDNFNVWIYAQNKPDSQYVSKKKSLIDYLCKIDLFKYVWVNLISKRHKNDLKNVLNFYNNYRQIYMDEASIEFVKNSKVKLIHCHYIIDAVKVINTLKREGLNDVKVILTSHVPESAADEHYNIWRENGYSHVNSLKIKKIMAEIEKFAFAQSDILLFPCKEALEPYYQTIKDFDKWLVNKDIRFFDTGAKELKSTLSKKEARNKFKCNKKYVISFLGRHVKVKGYDILKEAGLDILSQRDDVMFLVGGKERPEVPAPKHRNWRELGWVNPADVLKACDLFILPNRMTYFDLVTLEVLSAGVPIIASETGGNKKVQKDTGALILFDCTKEDLIKKINDFLNLDDENKKSISENCIKAYKEHYTPEIFAKNYLKVLKEIIRDYSLNKDNKNDIHNSSNL